MKKILIAGIALASSMGLFAQGSFTYNNDKAGSPLTALDAVFHVYSPQVPDTGTVTGNSSVLWSSGVRSGDYPQGTQTYTGTLIGGSAVGSGPTGWANGADYSADIIAAPGDNAPLSSLTFVAGSTVLFSTSSATQAGFWVAPAGALGIPGTTYSGSGVTAPTSASIVVQAWYSGGTSFPTYASAVAAGMPAGQGAEFNLENLGGGSITTPNMVGGQSFSLTTFTVPEPGTIALGVMGVCAFLARRRLKK